MEPNSPDNRASRPHEPVIRGWHSRGFLRHFDAGEEYSQFITFRLADSLPDHVVRGFEQELCNRPETERKAQLHRLLEDYLDRGVGGCYLRQPEIAEVVEGAIVHFDGARYALHSWVVMPNHVHVLMTPAAGESLSDIMHSW